MELLDVISKGLIVYGPLGIGTLVSMLAALRLYRDLQAERDRNRLAEAALVERFVAKAETWTTRYHELAESLVRSINAHQQMIERVEKLLERWYSGGGGRGGGPPQNG